MGLLILAGLVLGVWLAIMAHQMLVRADQTISFKCDVCGAETMVYDLSGLDPDTAAVTEENLRREFIQAHQHCLR